MSPSIPLQTIPSPFPDTKKAGASLNVTGATPPSVQGATATSLGATEEKDDALRKTAQDFEAAFISEMLAHAGLDKALTQNTGFGGEAFSGMLVEVYAERLAEKGAFGIGDKIYAQLKEKAE